MAAEARGCRVRLEALATIPGPKLKCTQGLFYTVASDVDALRRVNALRPGFPILLSFFLVFFFLLQCPVHKRHYVLFLLTS